MGAMRDIKSGLAALRGKAKRNSEMEEELQAYLDNAIEDLMGRGMSREDATRSARKQIGSVESVKHKVWASGWESGAERLWNDLVYSVRRLLHAPGLVFAIVLSIGLGLGANATIFSLVSKFILAPAPVGDPRSLTSIFRTYENGNCCNYFPMPVYRDIRDQAKSFSGVAAYYDLVPASISGGADPERIWGQATTENYFDVAQLHMALGRGFATNEEKTFVVVLGYNLWQHRFHGDPAIAGRTIALGGIAYTVVGVAPRGFRGIELILDPQFWVPLGTLSQLTATAPDPESRASQWLHPAARLKPGVTVAEAQAEMDVLGRRLAAQYPATDKDDGLRVEAANTLPPHERKTLQLFLLALSIVVLLVLCIACANVANLLLAQGAKRQREMAVRLALGASRAQLLRQMLLESVMLAMCGGIVGIALSLWATFALSSFKLPVPIPMDLAVSVDWRVLIYTFVLSIVAGITCGFVPAWIASRPAMQSALKGENALARPGRKWSLRNILVVAQITLSLVLLCAAGLFLRSLQGAARIDVGFRSRGVLIVAIDPQLHNYTPAKTIQLLNAVRDRIVAMPGVLSATMTDGVPLSMGHRNDSFSAEGEPEPAANSGVEMYMAGPDYLKTLGIPLLAGREFKQEDAGAPKVAVVNQEVVRRFYRGKNPIGRRMLDNGVPYQIIGIAKDTKARTIGEDQRSVLYRSINQAIQTDPSADGYQFMVRYEGDPGALAAEIRNAIHGQDATLAVFNTETMEEHMRDALFLPRLLSTLFSIFGAIGLLLAAVGLYGVMSYSVSQRTKEIGIRMAMGARADEVQSLVVRGGMTLALISVGLGLPLALGASRLATSMLYGIRPYDLPIFTIVPALLLAVALLACWVPSRRASRVDPMVALRVD